MVACRAPRGASQCPALLQRKVKHDHSTALREGKQSAEVAFLQSFPNESSTSCASTPTGKAAQTLLSTKQD